LSMKNDSACCTWPKADAVCIIAPSVMVPAKKPGRRHDEGEDDGELAVGHLIEGELGLGEQHPPAVGEDVGEALRSGFRPRAPRRGTRRLPSAFSRTRTSEKRKLAS
jgi:hypothetical protein